MGRIMKRILIVLALAAVLAGTGYGGFRYLREHYLYWEGALLRKDAQTVQLGEKQLASLENLAEFPDLQTIDLLGSRATPEQYEAIRAAYPRCRVLWEVPFQGRYYPQDSAKLVLTELSEADLALLDYLPELTSIDAWDCPEYDRLFRLQQQRPGCKIFYNVPVQGESWPCETSQLALRSVTAEELNEKLPYLPRVRTVSLSGELPSLQKLEALQEAWPEIDFTWQVTIGSMELDKRIGYLSLKDPDSARQAAQLLGYFPELESVNLLDSGLTGEEALALAEAFPEVEFLFQVTVASVTVRSDARELILSGTALESVAEVERWLPCLTELERVEMCGCGIGNEEMDALSKRWPQIRFIWSIDFDGILLRTDARYFAPNKWGIKVDNEMAKDLCYMVDMVCVDVGHMKELTTCEWAAHMPKLKYLVLADSGIGDITPLTGLTDLVFLELFLAPVRDLSPLVTLTALEDLNLSYVYTDPTPVGEMTWLKRVWWAGNWQASVLLPQKLPDAEMDFNQPSSTGGNWRKGQNYYDMRDFIGMGYMTG